MRRPILVGLNNPHSNDPRAALLPRPTGSAGHRLFKMSGMSWSDYRAVFERANVVDIDTPHRRLANRRVVVFGYEAWEYLCISDNCLAFAWLPQWGSRIYFAPHPSGRNLFYNDERNRGRMRRLLRDLWRHYDENSKRDDA